jgi:RNA polymerase sigma-70 factor, ECF subfamily
MVEYQQGVLRAFDQIYAHLAVPLRQYLSVLARDTARAEDLLQETFLQIHRSRHTYEPSYPLLPWVFAIARNVYRMQARAAVVRRAAYHVSAQDVEVPIPPEVDGLADRLAVRAALNQVVSDRREALLLHHVWGLSFREIGAMVGVSESAAKLRSSRGMADLRALVRPATPGHAGARAVDGVDDEP